MDSTQDKALAYVKDRTLDANGNEIHHSEDLIWGFGDKDMLEDDKKYATIYNRQ